MRVDMLDQAVGILAHLEEIRLFLRLHDRASAFRTFPVHQLGLGPEGLVRGAVPAFIGSFIDVALGIHLFKHLLNLFLMIIIGGADEFVIGSVHQIPDPFDLSGYVVHIFFR